MQQGWLFDSGRAVESRSIILKVVLCGVFIGFSCIFMFRYPIAAAFFYILISAYVLLLAGFLIRSCLIEHRPTTIGNGSMGTLLSILGLGVLFAFLLEMLTLWGAPVSTPLEISDWSKKRILVFLIISISVETVVLFSYKKNRKDLLFFIHSQLSNERGQEKGFLNSIPAMLVVTLLGIVVFLLLAAFTSFIFGEVAGRCVLFLLCFVSGAYVLLLAFRGVLKRPEIIFLSLCLVSGSILVFALPPVTALSWDDEIHFDRALGLSYLGHAEISEADRLLVQKPWAAVDLDFNVVRQGVEDVASSEPEQNGTEGYSEVLGFSTPIGGASLANISTIGYFPSAISLWIARLFHMPILFAVVLGRFGNLISYALVIAFAIRVAPIRKGVMAAIGLLPTSVFLAASYSYDPVVISFLMLAVALVLREVKTPSEKLTKLGLGKMMGALFVGLAPKAIYFPLVGLLFLMPRAKFESKRSHRKYLGCVIAFGLLMVATFTLPMFFSASAQAGDVRGGTDVNAAAQIVFILTNPFEYAQILVQFMLSYLSPVGSDMYTLSYAYMGFLPSLMPWMSSLGFLLLTITVMLDFQFDAFPKSRGSKIWVAFLFLLSVALVCTSLYVSYTPVALSTINGVQPRYLTPLLLAASLCVPTLDSSQPQAFGSCVPNGPSMNRAYILVPSTCTFLLLSVCSLFYAVFW